MRNLLAVTAAALVACGPSPDVPARGPAAPSASQAAPAPPSAGSTLEPPGSLAAPLVVIGAKSITLDGKIVGSVTAIDQLGRLQKIDELYQDMKGRRIEWEAAHKEERFSGIVYLGVAPATSGNALSSVLQTISFSGFSTVHVLVGAHYVETRALVPQPPCESAGEVCLPDPLQEAGARVVHVQADEGGWLLRVPRDLPPLERHDDASPQSLERFRSALALLPSSETVGAVVFHVSERGTFSTLAPFLDALATFAQQRAARGGVMVSIRDIDYVPPPDPPPEAAQIQRILRTAFGKLRMCYEHALRKDPNAEGRALTRLVIGDDGRASTAQTTLTGSLPPEMATCMQNAFLGLVFPPAPGGHRVIQYPTMFSPGG